ALARCARSVELYESLHSADPRNSQSQRDLARGLLFASRAHARLAAGAAGTPQLRAAHRRRAAESYEEGEHLLARLREPDRPTGDDSLLLAQVRAALASAPPQR